MAIKIPYMSASQGDIIFSVHTNNLNHALNASEAFIVDISGSLYVTGSFKLEDITGSEAFNQYLVWDSGSGQIYRRTIEIAETASFALTASLALNAISASYAVSASHEIIKEVSSSFADFATSSSHAELADNATNAVSSSYAITASFAVNAGDTNLSSSIADRVTVVETDIETLSSVTASYATTASNTFIDDQIISGSLKVSGSIYGDGANITGVISSSHAVNSDFAISASYSVSASHEIIKEVSSSFADFALSASHAEYAISSSAAISSSDALSAQVATSASHAVNADASLSSSTAISSSVSEWSQFALSASFADYALSSSAAIWSDTANSASHALQADNSLSASAAVSAANAVYADNATSASFAVSASHAVTSSFSVRTDIDVHLSASIWQSSSEGIFLNDDKARVGIGTIPTLPSYSLYVNGEITGSHIHGKLFTNYSDSIPHREADAHFGELHVGIPEEGKETVLGEGDSYTRGMLVYTYESSSDTYKNVSISGSTTNDGLSVKFPTTGSDDAIYMASSLSNNNGVLDHFGIKLAISSSLNLGSGNLQTEYWNGSVWQPFNIMVTEGTVGALPFAQQLYDFTGSYQVRYDWRMHQNWIENDPVGYGTNLFWARYRIEQPISASFQLEQIKLHSNRFEVNADGFIEYFGHARPWSTLPWDIGLLKTIAGATSDQNIYLSDNLSIAREANRFDSAKTGKIGFNSFLPHDADTSCPIQFLWNVFCASVAAYNPSQSINWTVRWGHTSEGDFIYDSAVGAPTFADNGSEQSASFTVLVPDTEYKSKIYSYDLDISNLIARRDSGSFGDMIWVTLERPLGDTFSGNVTCANIIARYTNWNEGGHQCR